MAWKIPRFRVRSLLLAVAAVAVMLAVMIAGSREVESLRDPQGVRGWDADGLALSDGRRVPLPGIHNLPAESRVLDLATRHGVEIGRDGRVVGLMRIHHWCGSDPIRYHLARVDLARMMMYLGEVPLALPAEIARIQWPRDGRFTEWGWDMTEYYAFRGFQVRLAEAGH